MRPGSIAGGWRSRPRPVAVVPALSRDPYRVIYRLGELAVVSSNTACGYGPRLSPGRQQQSNPPSPPPPCRTPWCRHCRRDRGCAARRVAKEGRRRKRAHRLPAKPKKRVGTALCAFAHPTLPEQRQKRRCERLPLHFSRTVTTSTYQIRQIRRTAEEIHQSRHRRPASPDHAHCSAVRPRSSNGPLARSWSVPFFALRNSRYLDAMR